MRLGLLSASVSSSGRVATQLAFSAPARHHFASQQGITNSGPTHFASALSACRFDRLEGAGLISNSTVLAFHDTHLWPVSSTD